MQVNPFILSASCQQQTFNEVTILLIQARHVFAEFFLAPIRSLSIKTEPIAKMPYNKAVWVQWTHEFESRGSDLNEKLKANKKLEKWF